MRKNRASLRWWFLFIVHNCIAHPLLVVGELIDTLGFALVRRRWIMIPKLARRLTFAIDRFHDATIADGDTKNLVKQLRGS